MQDQVSEIKVIEYTGVIMKVFDLALSASTPKANAARQLFSNSMQIGHDHYRGCSLNLISKYDSLITFH